MRSSQNSSEKMEKRLPEGLGQAMLEEESWAAERPLGGPCRGA